jgi:hypothetical protein
MEPLKQLVRGGDKEAQGDTILVDGLPQLLQLLLVEKFENSH